MEREQEDEERMEVKEVVVEVVGLVRKVGRKVQEWCKPQVG